jgi:hypothetical protein
MAFAAASMVLNAWLHLTPPSTSPYALTKENPMDQATAQPTRPLSARQARWPVVQGTVTPEGDVSIRCPFCMQTHHHGAAPGPRVSHCQQGPGYVIDLPGLDASMGFPC